MNGILYPNSLGLATLEDAVYYLEEKYHKDGGGGDSGAGGALIVHIENGVLDKTWQEIVDASLAVLCTNIADNLHGYSPLALYGQDSSGYYVQFGLAPLAADSPDGYPAAAIGPGPGPGPGPSSS